MNPISVDIPQAVLQNRLNMIRQSLAQPIPLNWQDPAPGQAGPRLFIGNKYHAGNVALLQELGITAVLNCASGGISRLPVGEMKEAGIMYAFTNVRQDEYNYPILHEEEKGGFIWSQHLEVAQALYTGMIRNQPKGKVLFFCVAGQNRSATLALAVLMLHGMTLDSIVQQCAKTRPIILENEGFQKQLVELEAILQKSQQITLSRHSNYFAWATPQGMLSRVPSKDVGPGMIEIELLIPGLCTLECPIPEHASIGTVKETVVNFANRHILAAENLTVANSWCVLAISLCLI